MKIWAIITTDFSATHKWPKDVYDTPEGDYLRWRHRHKFFVTIKIEQRHDNRDVEYLNFKNWIEGILRSQVFPMHEWMSCEMIAKEVAQIIRNVKKYRHRDLFIAVMEDNENGCEVEFPKEEERYFNEEKEREVARSDNQPAQSKLQEVPTICA